MNKDGSWVGNAVCDGSDCFGTGKSVGRKKMSGSGIKSRLLPDGRGAGDAAMGEATLIVSAGSELCNRLRRQPKPS